MAHEVPSVVEIRPVQSSDESEWVRMRVALWPESPGDHAPEVRDYLAAPPANTAVFVAVREGGGLGGFVEVASRPFAEGCATRPVAYLEGWWVDPDLRLRGVGARLVAAAEQWARSRGYTEMASDAALDNPGSQRAHARLGYEEALRVVCYCKKL